MGAGLVLSRAALDGLADKVATDADCQKAYAHEPEDLAIAVCLQRDGVLPTESRDQHERERFHPFSPGEHFHKQKTADDDWYARYSIDLKYGADCCSTQSVSFSDLTPDGAELRRIDALVHACPAVMADAGEMAWLVGGQVAGQQ